jgi:hypothetical protein
VYQCLREFGDLSANQDILNLIKMQEIAAAEEGGPDSLGFTKDGAAPELSSEDIVRNVELML